MCETHLVRKPDLEEQLLSGHLARDEIWSRDAENLFAFTRSGLMLDVDRSSCSKAKSAAFERWLSTP